MKILHVGLCVDGKNEGLPFAIKEASDLYVEISTGADDLESKILEAANTHKFDVAFFQIQSPNIVSPRVFDVLRQRGVFTVNWSGDIRKNTPPWYLQTGARLTLFTNERDVNTMRDAGYNSDFLQIGIDPKVFKRWHENGEANQVVFMGNHYGNQFTLGNERLMLANQLMSKGYTVIGGYRGAAYSLNGNQKGESIVYNNSLIGINHSHFDEPRYTSDRMFRILGSGCFCLSHHYKGIEEDFEIGTHLDTYQDIRDMQRKIGYYLEHTEERNQIAQAGFDYCHKTFTYKNMVSNLLELVDKYKK